MVTLSTLVLFGGWGIGISSLTSISANWAAMAPSTAACFLMIGVVLLSRFVRPLVVAPLCYVAWTAAAIAFANLVIFVSGAAIGVDALIWPSLAAERVAMSPVTSVLFLSAAFCMRRLARESVDADLPYTVSATFGLLTAAIDLVGYVFDSEALFHVIPFSSMALHTAIGFICLFVGLLLLRPRDYWIGVLLGQGSGSTGARRLTLIAVAAPLGLSYVVLALTEAGVVDANFRLSLLAIVMAALLAAAVLRNGAIENKVEAALTRTMKDLEEAVDDRDVLLGEVFHRVKNNLQQIDAIIQIESMSVGEATTRQSLEKLSGRVHALAMAHQMLISEPQLSRVECAPYLDKLCRNIAHAFGASERGIEITVEADPERLHVDETTLIGLLVNELVTNALKHGFPDDDGGGAVSVSYRRAPSGDRCLRVVDNGVGGAFEAGGPSNAGTGTSIVQSLIAQLKGEAKYETDKGVSVSVIIPVKKKMEK